MELNKNIFREYDIRGVYGTEFDEETAYNIGAAYAKELISLGKKEVVLGHDNRLSSNSLEEAMLKGLQESGLTIYRLGLVTTPMCYFAANYLKTDASMMITASHNPKEYNGFKFSYNGIHNAYGDSVKKIYENIINKDYVRGLGKIIDYDITEPYIDLVIDKLNIGKKKIKVVYDCGNGTTSIIADKVFSKLTSKFNNIEAIPLFNISDGNFPNHHPDPCVYENLSLLKDKMIEVGADVGIGYDGDGDRVGFLDEQGNMIETDKFMAIMWDYYYDKVDKLEGMYDVKCSKLLEDELIKLGVKPTEYRTGNSYTRCESARGNYPISGEYSGHVYFRDKWPGYDDGLYNGMRILEMLSNINEPLSSLVDKLPKYYQTSEIKVPVTDDTKFEIVKKVVNYCHSRRYNTVTIDGAKAKFVDGFALVRTSNTGPNLTMRFEAKTQKRLVEITKEFTTRVNNYIIKEKK